MEYSIIIVTHERADLLQRCIAEIRKQSPDAPIFVGINGTDKKALQYLQNISQVTCKSFPRMSSGEIRNQLIKLVETPWICFLGDDTIARDNYFQKAKENISVKSLEIFGGPVISYPGERNLESAMSLALSSPLTTGPTRKRHIVSEEFNSSAKEQDYTLSNLWIRTSIFQKEGNLFDLRFYTNEESVLLYKLLREGKVAHHYGDLYVHQKKNSNLIFMILAIMKDANSRAKSFILFPRSFQFIYLIPSLSFLYLIYTVLKPTQIGLAPIYIYLFFLIFFSWKICSKQEKMNLVLQVFLLQGLMNLSYAIGFISPPRTIK